MSASRSCRLLAVPVALLALLALALPAAADDIADAERQAREAQRRVGSATEQAAQLRARVEAAAARLTEGTRRLDDGRTELEQVRAQATQTRADAAAAEAQAGTARRRLGIVVAEAYRTPVPDGNMIGLTFDPELLRDAALAQADLDHIRGNKQDLLVDADAARVRADGLVRQTAALEADAAARERSLADQVTQLSSLARSQQQEFDGAAAALAAAQQDSRDAADQVVQEKAAEAARRAAAARAAAARAAAAKAAAARAQAATARAQAAREAAAREAAAGRAAAAAAARAEAARQEELAARRRASAASAAAPAPSSGSSGSSGSGGASCAGGSVAGYPNGYLPESALCPLHGAPGHRLRADAAAAFNRMTAAHTLCVTDSYRSYAAQVDVYSRKPDLAAVPGTSNHGLGQAVDLGCGAQSFGTPMYSWLKANAGRFGFMHPSWAEPGGSRPEPWHWEYVG